MKLYVVRFNMNIWAYIHMNIMSFISTMTFCFNIPVFCYILDRCTSIVLNWCMFVIGIKFWKINQYMLTIHFYFTPLRPRLCVPWIYIMQCFIYLAAGLFTQELFVWYDMHTYVLSSSLSLSFLYTRAKIWLVSKGHLSKQLVCVRDGNDIIVKGFGWGSVVPNQFKRKQVSVYVLLTAEFCDWSP